MVQARIGIDVGGTFTDVVLQADDGSLVFAKLASTPEHPDDAVIASVELILQKAALRARDVVEVLHGTTVGSNTLLQKTGARCGLITTAGFRDVLEIGRVRTPTMFDLTWDKPEPLIPRQLRLEVRERTSAAGEVLQHVNTEDVLAAGRRFRDEDVQSVAVCLINSYRNPANEQVVADLLQQHYPELAVSASIAILPQLGEYERTSTTAINAYVLPALGGYLARLAVGLRRLGVSAPLLVANSDGGLSAAALAEAKPVFFVSSGRSAGVVGGARLGKVIGEPDMVVFDMGGTTASASLVSGGRLSRTSEYEFRAGISTPSRFIKAGGYMMRTPTIDVAEVGSGAGSIAAIDAGGLLSVGPRSAGARPGPVAYSLGGSRPTVTDANVVLGFLPTSLAEGALTLDVEAARSAIAEQLAAPLDLSVEEAAFGVREVVNMNMARAIRAVTVERGIDARDLTLLAFGGSGPVHACDLARTIGMRRVVIPRAPGVFTAMGMLASNVERTFLAPFMRALDEATPGHLAEAIAKLRGEGLAALADEGYAESQTAFDAEIDLRFRGQDSEVAVPLPIPVLDDVREELRGNFLDLYRGLYGYASDDAVEAVSLRIRARGLGRRTLDFRALASEGGPTAPARNRKVYFDRTIGWLETPVLDRAAFSGDHAGPLIIESPDTTVVIPPSARVSADDTGNLVAVFS